MGEEHEELASEVRELRSRNQALRTDLERFEDPRHTALYLGRLLLRPASRRARRVASRVKKKLLRRDQDLVSRWQGYLNPGFRPYMVHRASPPRADHPRVLHAVANFRTGGSARLVVDLIEGLGLEYEQRVIIRTRPPVQGYEGVVIDEYEDLTTARALRPLIKSYRPDIVHVHYVADHRKTWGDLDYRWYLHVFEAAAEGGSTIIENVNIPTAPYRSDAVNRYVFVSDYVRRRYACDGDPATVIYPGSDLARFRRAPESVRPRDTIGLVYRLQWDKLDEGSFDPIVHVLRRRQATRAIVVGGGPLLSPYRRVAAEAGINNRVTFAGVVAYSELPRWYGKLAAFVAPVHTESFGQASVFAMGMELPVAGYHVGALEEILGDAELLAPPEDGQALANILVGLLDDPQRAREIGIRNRRRAEEKFSLERMVGSYRALYAELSGADRQIAPSPEPAVPRRA